MTGSIADKTKLKAKRLIKKNAVKIRKSIRVTQKKINQNLSESIHNNQRLKELALDQKIMALANKHTEYVDKTRKIAESVLSRANSIRSSIESGRSLPSKILARGMNPLRKRK